LLAHRWISYGFIYSFLELAPGIAYITGFNAVVTNAATIIIMGVSSLGVKRSVLNKEKSNVPVGVLFSICL
jgi:hypothetical protein